MKTRQWLAALAIAIPFAAAAECEAPEQPAWIPDGDKATKEEMLEGQKIIQAFVEKGQAYVDCIDVREQKEMRKMMNMGEEERKARVAELNRKRQERNDVVEQMQAIAERFNRELQKFNESQSSGD